MMKHVLLAAAALAATPAAAAVNVSALAGAWQAPASSSVFTTFDFNGSEAEEQGELAAAGFTVSSTGTVALRSDSVTNQYRMPMPGDGSQYVSVQAGSEVSIAGSTGYDSISLYVGSVDTYNFITILDTAGNALRTFSGSELISPLTPNSETSYRLFFTADAPGTLGGLRIASTTANAAEFDNLVFAVPEPSTWALMLAGFGMVGMAMRARRRRTSVVFG